MYDKHGVGTKTHESLEKNKYTHTQKKKHIINNYMNMISDLY